MIDRQLPMTLPFMESGAEFGEWLSAENCETGQCGISPKTKAHLEELLFPRDVFKWMAALYRRESYPGKDIVLEMYYTDLDRCYQIVLGPKGSRLQTDQFMAATTRIETPYTVWKDIAAGKCSGEESLMRHRPVSMFRPNRQP